MLFHDPSPKDREELEVLFHEMEQRYRPDLIRAVMSDEKYLDWAKKVWENIRVAYGILKSVFA